MRQTKDFEVDVGFSIYTLLFDVFTVGWEQSIDIQNMMENVIILSCNQIGER